MFDIDGTLIDSEKAAIKSLQEVLFEEIQLKYTLDNLRFTFGLPSSVILSRLGIKNFDDIVDKWAQRIKLYHHEITVFPGVEILLKRIHDKGLVTGIITSKTTKELINDFVPFGLMNYFDIIICANDTTKHKPDPEPILKFLDKAKALKNKSLYVGDTVYDMKCAKAAGVDFALALWGANDHKIAADYKLQEPLNLYTILNQE